MREIKSIAVLGMGYVGLTLAVALSEAGFRVFGVETNPKVVAQLKRGQPHFFENQLDIFLRAALAKNLSIATGFPDKKIDAFVMCVATPIKKNSTEADLNAIQKITKDIGQHLQRGSLVILRSTVPVGTTRNVVLPQIEKRSGLKGGVDFDIAFCPERTVEGKALVELRTNPQIIGGFSQQAVERAGFLFSSITPTILRVSSLEAAEMIKMMDNSFRDTVFAYANEIAQICEHLGLDAKELIEASNTHYPRNRIPKPSPGVGGGCLNKDPWILFHDAQKKGYTPRLLAESRKLNRDIPARIVKKIAQKLKEKGKDIQNARFFLIGFAFKGQPETDDLRDSTSVWLLEALRQQTKNISGFDPVVSREKIEALGVLFVPIEKGVQNADVVMFLNNHKSYEKIDPVLIIKKMNANGIFYDAWRMFDKKLFNGLNQVTYMGVGYG